MSFVLSFLRRLDETAVGGVACALTILTQQTPPFIRKTLMAPLVGVSAPTTEVTDDDNAGVSRMPALSAPPTERRRGRYGLLVGGRARGIRTTEVPCVIPAGVCEVISLLIVVVGSAVDSDVIIVVIVIVVVDDGVIVGVIVSSRFRRSGSRDGGWWGSNGLPPPLSLSLSLCGRL